MIIGFDNNIYILQYTVKTALTKVRFNEDGLITKFFMEPIYLFYIKDSSF